MKSKLFIVLVMIIGIMLVGCGSKGDINNDNDVKKTVENAADKDDPIADNSDLEENDEDEDPDDSSDYDDVPLEYYVDESGNPMLFNDDGSYICTIYLPGGFQISDGIEDMTWYELTDGDGGCINVTAGALLEDNFGYIEENGDFSIEDGFEVFTYQEEDYLDRQYLLGVDGNYEVFLVTQSNGELWRSLFYTSLGEGGVRIELSKSVTEGFGLSDYIYLYNRLLHNEMKYSGFTHQDVN